MCLNLAFCGCQQLCGECCDCCKTTLAPSPKQQVRLGFFFLFLLFGGLSIILLYFAQIVLQPFQDFIHCPQSSGGKLFCLGVSGVYRISLALATLFVICFICSICKNTFSKAINEGCWFFKFLICFGLFITYLFIDNTFFEGYVSFARAVGVLYLIFQIIMLIDLSYLWGENWITHYNEGNKTFGFLLILCTLSLYVCVIVLIVYNFIWFSGGFQTFVSIFQIALVILITFLSISGIATNGSLLTSGAISLYTCYLVWSGFANSPNASENTLLTTDAGMITDLVIGGVLIVVSIGYYSWTNESTIGNKIVEVKSDEKNPLSDHDGNDKKEDLESHKMIERDLDLYKGNQILIFHFIMIVASIYYTLLMTNWGSPRFNSDTISNFQPSSTSFWIKIILSWVSSLIYIWTLVAPRIFKNRSFN